MYARIKVAYFIVRQESKSCCLQRGVKQNIGKAPVLRKAHTPFLSEDHTEAPAARPAEGGKAIACPWCKCSFPETVEGGFVLEVAIGTGKGCHSWRGSEKQAFRAKRRAARSFAIRRLNSHENPLCR